MPGTKEETRFGLYRIILTLKLKTISRSTMRLPWWNVRDNSRSVKSFRSMQMDSWFPEPWVNEWQFNLAAKLPGGWTLKSLRRSPDSPSRTSLPLGPRTGMEALTISNQCSIDWAYLLGRTILTFSKSPTRSWRKTYTAHLSTGRMKLKLCRSASKTSKRWCLARSAGRGVPSKAT